MPVHRDFVAAFDAALRGGALPPGLTARAPDEAARRFGVYRNNVAVSLTEALAARFPVILRLVGEEFFCAMAGDFATAHRPTSPVLAEWGQAFPDFLDGFAPLAAYPYMGDVARIEYARGRAFHAADACPLPVSALVGADPALLQLSLHPSVTLLHLAHPAVTIWAQNQPGARPAPVPAHGEVALILRDAVYEVQVQAIGPDDAALIRALQAGAPLAQAAALARMADPAHDAQPVLVALMRAGAFVQPEG